MEPTNPQLIKEDQIIETNSHIIQKENDINSIFMSSNSEQSTSPRISISNESISDSNIKSEYISNINNFEKMNSPQENNLSSQISQTIPNPNNSLYPSIQFNEYESSSSNQQFDYQSRSTNEGVLSPISKIDKQLEIHINKQLDSPYSNEVVAIETINNTIAPPSLQITSEDNQTVLTDERVESDMYTNEQKRDSKEDQDSIPLSFLKFEDVEPYFDLRLEDACEKLGISTTSMKKICRQWYIQRWPFRKLKSLQTKLEKIKKQLKEDSEEDPERKLSLYVRLRLEEQLKSVSDEILQIRSKNTYEDRKKKDQHLTRSFDSSSSSSHSPQFHPHLSPHHSPHLSPHLSPHPPSSHPSPHLSPHYSPHYSQGSSPIYGQSLLQTPPFINPYTYQNGALSAPLHSPYYNTLHLSPNVSPNLSNQMSHLNLTPFQLNPEYAHPRDRTLPAFGSQQQYQPNYYEDQSNSRGIFSDLRKVQIHAQHPSQENVSLPSFSSLIQSIEGNQS